MAPDVASLLRNDAYAYKERTGGAAGSSGRSARLFRTYPRETLRFPPATSRVSCLPSLQTPGNGTSGEATQQLSTMLTESAFPQIKFFATGQAIPEASLGVFNARPYTPACGRPQKTGVNYNDSRVGVFTPFE